MAGDYPDYPARPVKDPRWVDPRPAHLRPPLFPTDNNRVQQSIEAQIVSVAADTRKHGPVYGRTKIPGRIGICQQIGTNIYIRAEACMGEINQIVSVEVNGSTYLTGDPTADPDYLGNWEDAATWSGLGGLPYSASAGEIWKYGASYYELQTDISITAYTGSYTPTGAYANFFKLLITNASVNTYTGTSTQGVDALLSAAGGALAGYDETLRGTWEGTAFAIAYAVLCLPAADWQGGFPRVTLEVEGMLVYDPRTVTTAYSNNPALCLADFLSSPLYGRGAGIDWTSFGTLADYLDEVFADGPRYELNLNLTTARPQPTANWVNTLREYARCWLDYRDGEYVAIADAPATSSGTLQPDNGGDASIIELADDPAISAIPVPQRHNLVRVFYTDGTSYETKQVESSTAGVDAGTEPVRLLELRMPGLNSAEQAQRYADERRKRGEYELWEVTFPLFDAGLRVDPGEVWTLSAPNGFSAQAIRILGRDSRDLGDYTVRARQYAASVYEAAP